MGLLKGRKSVVFDSKYGTVWRVLTMENNVAAEYKLSRDDKEHRTADKFIFYVTACFDVDMSPLRAHQLRVQLLSTVVTNLAMLPTAFTLFQRG